MSVQLAERVAGVGPALVLGPTPGGLAHQAVVSLLERNGVAVVAEDGAKVAVLYEAGDEDWAAARAAALPIVVVEAEHAGDSAVVDAVLRGADAVVHADASPAELISVVSMVAAGGTVLSPAQVRAVATVARRAAGAASPAVRLTRREAEIIESIANGDAVKQTARLLGISAKTVENLQSRLFRKLGVHNRAQAVAKACALGMV